MSDQYDFDYTYHEQRIVPLIKALQEDQPLDEDKLYRLQKQHTRPNGYFYSKAEIIYAYRQWCRKQNRKPKQSFINQIRMKPARTASGVVPVAVFTKPYPCSGNCLFCPTRTQVPQSYLKSEPGVQRARRNDYNPYAQVVDRLLAYYKTGHPVDKVELIILGGTWSDYPFSYQRWFIGQCFKALNEFNTESKRKKPAENDFGWKKLTKQQQINETADCRCVGLVVETRPDKIDSKELKRLRRFGVTKVQIGIQFLDDKVLRLNRRGHGVAEIKRAFLLLRQFGFKIHAHWMANLYGSGVSKDKKNYQKMFTDPAFRPDELKIYPCMLLAGADLLDYFQQGKWQPYSEKQLADVLSFCLTHTPPYCRLSRVVRDIPAGEILAGSKQSNFRQVAQEKVVKAGKQMRDIRAREITTADFDSGSLRLDKRIFQTSAGQEVFLQFIVDSTSSGRPNNILAFLRLSLPGKEAPLQELAQAAIIREVHVYGPTTPLGQASSVQHQGLGSKLIEKAEKIAVQHGFGKLAVISAVGTREYYRRLGFQDGKLYQSKRLLG